MKLTVLAENTASHGFIAEHGLSYLIEYDNKTILFDTGYSDVFLQNAKKLNIDIETVNTIVLSHGHWDHCGGLRYLKNKTLICHPKAFIKRFRKIGNIPLENIFSAKDIENKFNLITSASPYYINENMIFLGEIPRINTFENQPSTYITETGENDNVIDDSALVINDKDGIIVITGCSHSGICNIIDYAKKVTQNNKVKAVIGGFHLKQNNSRLKKTIEYFKKEKINHIYPSHCTELPALAAFHFEFNTKAVKTGMVFHF